MLVYQRVRSALKLGCLSFKIGLPLKSIKSIPSLSRTTSSFYGTPIKRSAMIFLGLVSSVELLAGRGCCTITIHPVSWVLFGRWIRKLVVDVVDDATPAKRTTEIYHCLSNMFSFCFLVWYGPWQWSLDSGARLIVVWLVGWMCQICWLYLEPWSPRTFPPGLKLPISWHKTGLEFLAVNQIKSNTDIYCTNKTRC